MRKATSKNGKRKAAPKKEERPVSELGRDLRKLAEKARAARAKPLTLEDVQRENWHKW